MASQSWQTNLPCVEQEIEVSSMKKVTKKAPKGKAPKGKAPKGKMPFVPFGKKDSKKY